MKDSGKHREEVKGKLHRSQLNSEDCYLLVSRTKMFIWVGSQSDK